MRRNEAVVMLLRPLTHRRLCIRRCSRSELSTALDAVLELVQQYSFDEALINEEMQHFLRARSSFDPVPTTFTRWLD